MSRFVKYYEIYDYEYESDEDQWNNCPQWCICGECIYMDDPSERICCQKIPTMLKLIKWSRVSCITLHPVFDKVLDPNVLEEVYPLYCIYKRGYQAPLHQFNYRSYRYTAYRHLVRCCWGYLGKNNRVQLPACAISKIRSQFCKDFY
ncbi:uncharacterized protein O3C94_013380 [Discoglossus pictus]